MQETQLLLEELHRLKQENEHYRQLLSNLSAGFLTVSLQGDDGGRILEIGGEFTKLTGYTMAELAEQKEGLFLSLVDPRDLAASTENIASQLKNDGRYDVVYRMITKAGGSLWVREAGHIKDVEPPVRIGILTDVSALMWHQEQLAQSEQLFRITNDASGGAVFDFDFATGAYLHFENAERIYGVPAERIISETKWFGSLEPKKSQAAMIDYFYHPDDSALVADAFSRLTEEKSIHYVARSKRADGSFLWTQVHIALIFDDEGHPVRRVGHLIDIDDMTKQMEKLRNQAQEDPLTGIYNKMAAQAIVDTVLKKKADDLSALMVLDIDNFKGVNDTLGHAVGDAVLVDVCNKLKSVFPDQTLGRVGGDEFIVFIMALHSEAEVLQKAEQICNLFREIRIGPANSYEISCSIGIAVSDDENRFSELFKKADEALYSAKTDGKNRYCLYKG